MCPKAHEGKDREEPGNIDSEAFCAAKGAQPEFTREARTGEHGRRDEQELTLRAHEASCGWGRACEGHGRRSDVALATPSQAIVCPRAPRVVLGVSMHPEHDRWRVHAPQA